MLEPAVPAVDVAHQVMIEGLRPGTRGFRRSEGHGLAPQGNHQAERDNYVAHEQESSSGSENNGPVCRERANGANERR